MRHVIELETDDLDQLFHEGLKLPAGDNVMLKAKLIDVPRGSGETIALPLLNVPQLPNDEPGLKFKCSLPGCDASYAVIGHLNNHILNKHGIARKSLHGDGNGQAHSDFYCDEHQKPFLNQRGLDCHNRMKHRSGGLSYKFACTDDLCPLTFPTPSARDNHMRKTHGD